MTGEILYRGYDRQSLDLQYNNRRRFSDYAGFFEKWQAWSAEARTKLRHRLDVPYGASAMERVDLFPAEAENAPLHVFIHGGYWQSLDKSDFSYVAEGMVGHGVTTAIINYALAPDADMDEIVRQNRAAIAWLWRHAGEFGADPSRLFISGHSAGGHLVLMLLATDWPVFSAGLPARLIRSACAISGIYDLEPIRLCYLNGVLRMSEVMAARNSPVRQAYPAKTPLQLALGGRESEEYYRQALAMAARWSDFDYPLDVVLPPELDHFSIIDGLRDPRSDLVQCQLRQIAD